MTATLQAPDRAPRRRLLLALLAYAVVMAAFWGARARWGLEKNGVRWLPMDHPFRIHVANRSQTPVLVDATGEDGHRRTSDGTTIPIQVRPLTADGPGSRPGFIEWIPEAGTDLHVVIDESGQPVRQLAPNDRVGTSFVHVRSRHELPIRVGWDMAPGNGGMYMPDAHDREDSSWVGTGVFSSRAMGFAVGEPASLTYAIPGVRPNARDLTLQASADGAVEIAIGRDGQVEAHPFSLLPRVLRALGF